MDGIGIGRLHADLKLDKPRTKALEQGKILLPQKIPSNLEMKIGDAVIVCSDILPDPMRIAGIAV